MPSLSDLLRPPAYAFGRRPNARNRAFCEGGSRGNREAMGAAREAAAAASMPMPSTGKLIKGKRQKREDQQKKFNRAPEGSHHWRRRGPYKKPRPNYD